MLDIKNAVKTFFSNPFNAISVTQFSIPTDSIFTPAHKEWQEWREKQCLENWDTHDNLQTHREDWFSEPDYLLIDITQLKDRTWQVVCFVDYHKPTLRAESEPEHLWQHNFATEPSLQDVITALLWRI